MRVSNLLFQVLESFFFIFTTVDIINYIFLQQYTFKPSIKITDKIILSVYLILGLNIYCSISIYLDIKSGMNLCFCCFNIYKTRPTIFGR